MVTHQTFTDYQSDIQIINKQLSQAMRDGDLPNNVNFTELDGSWHVCGEAILDDWILISGNNPSIFELKLPFKSGEVTILGDLPNSISLEKCSIFIQIDLQHLEKESNDGVWSEDPINEIDVVNLVRVEDPKRILHKYLPYLSTSISAFIRNNRHAIALSIRSIGTLNLHTNMKWLLTSFQTEQNKSHAAPKTLSKVDHQYLEANTPVKEPTPSSSFMAVEKKSGVLIRTKWLMKSLILPVLPGIISPSAQEEDLSLSQNFCIETIHSINSYPIKVGSQIYSTSYNHFRISPTNNGIILEASGKLTLGLNAELSFSIYAKYTLENNNKGRVTLAPDGKPIIKGQKNTPWYNCLDFRSGVKAENLFDIMLETITNSIDHSFKLLNQHLEEHIGNSLKPMEIRKNKNRREKIF